MHSLTRTLIHDHPHNTYTLQDRIACWHQTNTICGRISSSHGESPEAANQRV